MFRGHPGVERHAVVIETTNANPKPPTGSDGLGRHLSRSGGQGLEVTGGVFGRRPSSSQDHPRRVEGKPVGGRHQRRPSRSGGVPPLAWVCCRTFSRG